MYLRGGLLYIIPFPLIPHHCLLGHPCSLCACLVSCEGGQGGWLLFLMIHFVTRQSRIDLLVIILRFQNRLPLFLRMCWGVWRGRGDGDCWVSGNSSPKTCYLTFFTISLALIQQPRWRKWLIDRYLGYICLAGLLGLADAFSGVIGDNRIFSELSIRNLALIRWLWLIIGRPLIGHREWRPSILSDHF